MAEPWYDHEYANLAGQLSNGMLNEMRKRIEQSKIRGQKLELSEKSDRIKQFFEREIARYNKRKHGLNRKLTELEELRKENQELKDKLDGYEKST